MTYVKLQNNTIQYAPTNYITEQGATIFNFNKSEEIMREYGFKPLVSCDKGNGRRYSISYTEDENNVYEHITYTETQEEYEERIAQEHKEQRNREIDSKIKELNEMSVPEMLNNNIENLKVYREVIAGLEAARPL